MYKNIHMMMNLTHFTNTEDHSVPYDFSLISNDLKAYSQDSLPSFHTDNHNVYENFNPNSFLHDQNFQ